MSLIIVVSGVEDAFAGLDPLTVAKGTARGLTKMGQQVRTAIKSRLRGVYTVKAGAINKAVEVIPARHNNLETIVRASGRPVSFLNYQARQGKTGTRVKVRRDRSPVALPGKFIQQVQSLRGVFFRPDRTLFPRRHGNLPIHAFSGPSIPQLFGSRASFADMQKFITRQLNVLIAHEVMFEINKKQLRPGGRGV